MHPINVDGQNDRAIGRLFFPGQVVDHEQTERRDRTT